jgi:hypothetical protein
VLKYDPSRVKKDVLYKPLLRIFRNAIKDLNLDREDQFWDFERMKNNCWHLMHKLELPKEFMNLKGLHSMLLLLHSRIHNTKDLTNSPYSELTVF